MPRFRRLAVRFLLVAALAGGFGVASGRALVETALPILDFIAQAAWPNYVGRFEVVDDAKGSELRFRSTALTNIRVARDAYVPVGARIDPASTSLLHVLVPVVIALAALWAWPVAGGRDRIVRIAATVPLALAALAATAPLSLVALVEIGVRNSLLQSGIAAAESWPIGYLVFLETGGRWLIPIVLAALCVLAGRMPAASLRPEREPRYLGG